MMHNNLFAGSVGFVSLMSAFTITVIGPGNTVIKTRSLSKLPLWKTQSSALFCGSCWGHVKGEWAEGLLFEEFHLGARDVNTHHGTHAA